MAEHAKLSPSAFSRWSTCHLSIEMDTTMPDSPSAYAEKGTFLHALAETHLRAGTNINPLGGEDAEIVQIYLNHVRSAAVSGVLLVEQRLNYNDDLWGTADAVIFAPRTLKVIDLKTGTGIKVHAAHNGQGLTYAVMARREWGPIYGPFDTIEIHMVQPPLDHIDVWSITGAELDTFERHLEVIVARIAAGDRRAVPSESACQWCRAKATCRARADHNLAVIKMDFELPTTLSIDEIVALLPKLGQISKWCASLEQYAFEQATHGVTVPGYKLVRGKSNRVWRNEAEAAASLSLCGVPDAKLWKRKLLALGDAEKLLGKSHPVFGEICVKPEGAPALAPESDPRPALAQSGEDFSAII